MDITFHFPHLEKPVAFEELVEKKFHTLARRLDARLSINDVKVIADVVQRKPDGRASKFSVMISVHSSKPKRYIVARKTASDFKKALNEAVYAITSTLQKESEKMERSRKTFGHTLKSVRKMRRERLEPSED